MQRRIFWLIFISFSLVIDLSLSFLWGFIAMFPLLFLSWWIAYRSGWFD